MSMFRNPFGPIGGVAGGTIGPRRFVKLDTTTVGQYLQAGAGDQVIGVSQQGQKRAPGLPGSDTTVAAEITDEFDFYGPGQVAEVDAGGTVTLGDWVKSDANGKAVTHTLGGGDEYCAGRALVGGSSGTTIKVLVWPQQVA